MRISDWSSDVCSSDLLPTGARRRTPGLRREELAQLCGISVTWYTWIEQGRDVSVTASVLASLATVLSLARAERHELVEQAERSEARRVGKGRVSTDRTRW